MKIKDILIGRYGEEGYSIFLENINLCLNPKLFYKVMDSDKKVRKELHEGKIPLRKVLKCIKDNPDFDAITAAKLLIAVNSLTSQTLLFIILLFHPCSVV